MIKRLSLFSFPSSFADKAVSAMLADCDFTNNFVSVYQQRLQESYDYTVKLLEKHGIICQKSEATLFVWANLRAVVKDQTITDQDILAKLRDERVYITSGEGYRSEYSGWFRIVFAHPRKTLDEGLGRIIRGLEKM